MGGRATHGGKARGWKARNHRRERLLTLAGVGLVHLGVLLLVLTASPQQLRQTVEDPIKLITLRPPPPPPPPPLKTSFPEPARASPPPPPATKPRPLVRKPLPSVAPVAVAAEAETSLAGSVGTGASLGSIGTGLDLGIGGGGGGGGLSRHAAWIGGGISDRDYPVAAKRASLQGVVDVRVIVMTDGRVRNCTIDRSSGSADLDRLTCALVEQRLLFSPALDVAGKPIEEVSGRRFRYVMGKRRG